MSHLATNWAVLQRGISPVAKLILWHLADCHHPKHGCFPHIDTLVTNCEVSRATVLRVLHELEGRGMIVRIKRVNGHTKKQLTNKYILGFEADFGSYAVSGVVQVYSDEDEDEGRVSDCDPASTTEESRVRIPDTAQMHDSGSGAAEQAIHEESGASRVRIPDTAPGERSRVSDCDPDTGSRVSNQGRAGYQIEGEPGVTVETPIRSLTGNRTSNGTVKRAQGRDRDSLFAEIWKVFPRRPTSSIQKAQKTFSTLDDAEAAAAAKGAERYAAWWKLQEPGKAVEERLIYVKNLSTWLYERAWIEATKLPLPAEPGSDTSAVLADYEYVHKPTQWALFAECEKVRGKSVTVGKSGSWAFPKPVVAEARARLGSGSGPP